MIDTKLHSLDSVSVDAELVFLDSCASDNLFSVIDDSNLENFRIVGGSIQLTKKRSQLQSDGVGDKRDWTNITVSHDSIKNIVSAG
jgi:hypothetical protein